MEKGIKFDRIGKNVNAIDYVYDESVKQNIFL